MRTYRQAYIHHTFIHTFLYTNIPNQTYYIETGSNENCLEKRRRAIKNRLKFKKNPQSAQFAQNLSCALESWCDRYNEEMRFGPVQILEAKTQQQLRLIQPLKRR
jgi:hypothetical protein